MHSSSSYEETLRNLVHDLRQPLGNIETSMFYLDLVLDHQQSRVRVHLETMERQLAQATNLLNQAAAELHRQSAPVDQSAAGDGAETGESLDLTKSTTAAGT